MKKSLNLKAKLALVRQLAEDYDCTSTSEFSEGISNGEFAAILNEVCNLALKAIEQGVVDVSQVYKVYSGKAHKCACGCSGIYRVASAHLKYTSDDRGYPYEKSDDKFVKRVVKIINDNLSIATKARTDSDVNWVSVVIGERTYTAYIIPQTKLD